MKMLISNFAAQEKRKAQNFHPALLILSVNPISF